MQAARPFLSVLYVDDDADFLDLGKAYLERDGSIRLAVAMDAAEGLRLIHEQKFDAIISDYQMPSMDGIEFLRALRERGDSTPFIIFTGKGREEVVIQALNEGADFYLQKAGRRGRSSRNWRARSGTPWRSVGRTPPCGRARTACGGPRKWRDSVTGRSTCMPG